MSNEPKSPADRPESMEECNCTAVSDLLEDLARITAVKVPLDTDRRTFFMRSALVGATALMTGRSVSAEERTERSEAPAPQPPLSPISRSSKKKKDR